MQRKQRVFSENDDRFPQFMDEVVALPSEMLDRPAVTQVRVFNLITDGYVILDRTCGEDIRFLAGNDSIFNSFPELSE